MAFSGTDIEFCFYFLDYVSNRLNGDEYDNDDDGVFRRREVTTDDAEVACTSNNSVAVTFH